MSTPTRKTDTKIIAEHVRAALTAAAEVKIDAYPGEIQCRGIAAESAFDDGVEAMRKEIRKLRNSF